MIESQHIEWKASWRDEYLKWICGFANADGGTLIIGRDDDGVAVGIDNARKLLETLPNKIRDLLGIMASINLVKEGEFELIEIRIDPYTSPISYKGEYHYRSGSTKQILKGAALDQFLLRKQGRHWDGVPMPHSTINDLDTRTLGYFREQALRSQRLTPEILGEPDKRLLDKLHLTEGAYLTRAAVLLFHPEPEEFIRGAFVKIGFFETNADLRYHDEIHGNLLAQSRQIIEILQAKYLKALISYEGLQRIESYPVPEAALREVLLNAIVHKDYSSGTPIQISVYPNQLMIWNPGQLPQGWTVDDLLGKHASEPFNPDVANTFFRAGKIETWGRGIERVLEVCALENLPTPEFRYENTGLWTVFHFSEQYKNQTGRTVGGSEETPVETPVETPELILAIICDHPDWSLAQVAEAIGKSLRAVERAVAKLVKNGRLRHVGPSKGGYWEVI